MLRWSDNGYALNQNLEMTITETTQQLLALREHRSVRQLANEIGTSAEMVRRWLRGEAQPRVDTAETIREMFSETLGNHDFSVSKTKPKHHGGDDHIYEKLQALKEGSSVQVVAEKMGKHPEMIRRWLRRESKPRGESAKNINDMFSEIFGDYDSFVKRTKMLGNSKS
tara:strand:- start:12 stop:515 length:504 start_codon:yes stop_codon:yes gene_type:complete